eukprot:TRINITY_DN1066_c0_g2_i1.p1 TRINITY_DN1066_c0_g2~~TRINITY_DN1066_c0_g2_i1.p1  ORF type:complete len:135 (-),score=42.26 TRINITY_DN1066_c0_g2_i1:77-481(-)
MFETSAMDNVDRIPAELFEFMKKQNYTLLSEIEEKDQAIMDLKSLLEQLQRDVEVLKNAKTSNARKMKNREAQLLKQIDELKGGKVGAKGRGARGSLSSPRTPGSARKTTTARNGSSSSSGRKVGSSSKTTRRG